MEFQQVKRVRILGLESILYGEKTGRTNLTWRQLSVQALLLIFFYFILLALPRRIQKKKKH